ncbi:MAG: alpha/beta hydrolase [Ilumatobacter sp.]|uniref:alpha/beta fold hydrolase n=1 Tax=Ilumatobacter sp. TaxID=1967498 RepID=UPI002606BB59|nr:alpha/beta hydrolase [Ilumatobacter sp.]MDJ0771064.1 alpha/beta hydrolase [Ilumatobacter sp.]
MAVRQFVEIGRGPIEYELVRGDHDRPPLVFLHEGLGSIDLWRGLPAEIAERCGGATTLVYARHGYGQSAPSEMPRPVTYMHHEADVVLPALLAELHVERPVLVGHSDGASIALLFAGAGGDVAGLVCLAPHVFVEPESVAGIEAAREAWETTDLPARLGRYHADPTAAFRGWNDVWLSAEFRDWSIQDRLTGIEVPVFLVQGADDQYGTVAQLETIEADCAGTVERLLIEGAGHSPHLTAREWVVAAVADFIGRL